MKIIKRILLVLLGLLLIAQFIRPSKNISNSKTTNDINEKFILPQDVATMLRTSCYDCHSNETHYPWYAEVQPIGWWLNSHIQDAKRHLNFSEFASYSLRRQYNKLEDIAQQVNDGLMPLPSYLIIHTDARLSQEHKERLIMWANATRDSMMAQYSLDSLERRK